MERTTDQPFWKSTGLLQRSPVVECLKKPGRSTSLQTKAKVAFLKGLLILGAAVAVAAQIAWRLKNPGVPVFEAMGLAGVLNLSANAFCLWLLTPHRNGDINLSSAWECSRNDIYEGCAVLLAAFAVWVFGAGWPDLVIASALLLLFLRSAVRVMRGARQELRGTRCVSCQEESGGPAVG